MIINKTYAVVDSDGWILQTQTREEDDTGPMWPFGDDRTYVPLEGPIKGPRPTASSNPRIVDGVVVWVETLDIEGLKSRKNTEINEARLIANRTSFIFNGKEIACDELSQLDISSTNGIITLTQAMPDGWPGAWKTKDNSYVMIPDVATWINFYKAMVQKGNTNFAHSQQLKSTLATATTSQEIEAIMW